MLLLPLPLLLLPLLLAGCCCCCCCCCCCWLLPLLLLAGCWLLLLLLLLAGCWLLAATAAHQDRRRVRIFDRLYNSGAELAHDSAAPAGLRAAAAPLPAGGVRCQPIALAAAIIWTRRTRDHAL